MARIGQVVVGEKSNVKIMGIINSSPESFYKRSVKLDRRSIGLAAINMEKQGASIIDVGAMSTAPYLDTTIPVEKEAARMRHAIEAIRESGCKLPISADTPRARVAEVAIDSGAAAINDVTGLKFDDKMSEIVSEARVAVILGAHRPFPARSRGGISSTIQDLRKSILIAKQAGIRKSKIIVDPSIGFYRAEGKNPFFSKLVGMSWYSRDLEVLSELDKLTKLGPVCVSVSAKSFLGHLFGIKKADERIIPSVACELFCAIKGASIIRTHNVEPTVSAQTMLHLLSS